MKNNLLLSLLLVLAMSTYSFAQYSNADFEPGGLGDSWNWAVGENGSNPPLQFVANPDMTGINTSATSAEFTALASGNPWALCFADIDPFMFDATNSIVKIMVYKPRVSPVAIKFEGASGFIELAVSNTVIDQWEELTIDFSGSIGNTYNRIVIIPDNAPRTVDNVLYFDNIQHPTGNVTPPAAPTVAAPAPTSSDICALSIFSDAFTSVAGTDFDPNWGQITDATVEMIAGDNTLQYMNLNYQGTQFGSNQDVSAYEFIHVDFWTDNSTDLGFFLISPGLEIEYLLTPHIVAGSWVSVDIPLSHFSGTVNLTDVFQFKVDGNGNIWFDNLYFHGGTHANVSLPAIATPATITCTTSCEDSSWTYYEDPSNPGNYLMAIEWGAGNAAAKTGTQITINVDASPTMVDDGTEATWSMARYWNVTPGAGLVGPVNIKYFYDPAEKTAIETAMNADGRSVDGFEWFKTTGVDFNPATHVTGPGITGSPVVLTDVNTGGLLENGVLYAQFNGITSFSGGTGTAGVGSMVVPIELTYFRAEKKGKEVLLTWETATEKNNDYFQIERSNNGIDFEEIHQIKGSGNSESFKSYTSMDINPQEGNNYYRLKQVDLNGTHEYSNIVKVNLGSENTVSVYPVPVSNQLTIDYKATINEEIQLFVMDALGSIVASKTVLANAGDNQFTIDFSTIPKGSYFINLQSDYNRTIKTIIKN